MYKRPTNATIETFATIDGVDYNTVEVYWEATPAEPDVNWPGSFEVNSVTVCGKEMVNCMTGDELDDLTKRLYEDECAACEDQRY